MTSFDKLAELQYGTLPKLEAQLKAADLAATKVGADGTAANVPAWVVPPAP